MSAVDDGDLTGLVRAGPGAGQRRGHAGGHGGYELIGIALVQAGAPADPGRASMHAMISNATIRFDGRPQVVNWLRAEWNRTGRRLVEHGDITGLLEARSASVALASSAHGTHIYDFVDRMTDTYAEVANLNYWAHWIGEMDDEQTSDAFMLDDDARSWTGVRLLRHLTSRLEPSSPHLPLNLFTLHALIASRPSLLSGRPAVRASLAEALDKLASSDGLPRTGRNQLAGLQYALRIADL